jgi:hypothetical protein
MSTDDGIKVYRNLEEEFNQLDLHRPMRVERYEAGTALAYDITAVDSAQRARVRLRIKKFVGGGFAGQVYQVEIMQIDSASGPMPPGGRPVRGEDPDPAKQFFLAVSQPAILDRLSGTISAPGKS